jgi:hypothetical protein
MNTSSKIIWHLVAVAVLLIVGLGVGVVYQAQKDMPQFNKMSAVFKTMTSKTIPSIVAYGQVANIQGRDVTLSFSGDNTTINIKPDATVYSFASKTNTRQQIAFSDIKKGDTINVSVKISPDGQLQGDMIIVLPAQVNPAVPAK